MYHYYYAFLYFILIAYELTLAIISELYDSVNISRLKMKPFLHTCNLIFPRLVAVFAIAFISFTPKVKITTNATDASHKSVHGIVFIEEDWSRALAEAKKQKKLIFLDAYASWCGPCKLLKKKTFTDKEASEFFNRNFINVSVDMEKGEGLHLAETYEVYAVPTLIIADMDGNRVAYTKGFISPKELIEFGEYGLNKNK